MAKKIETFIGDPLQITESANAFLKRIKDKDPDIRIMYASTSYQLGAQKGDIIAPGKMEPVNLSSCQVSVIYKDGASKRIKTFLGDPAQATRAANDFMVNVKDENPDIRTMYDATHYPAAPSKKGLRIESGLIIIIYET